MIDIALLIGVIMALAKFLKRYVPSYYIPLITMVLGIVGGLFFLDYQTYQDAIIKGVIIGLSANGTYDATKLLHTTPEPKVIQTEEGYKEIE